MDKQYLKEQFLALIVHLCGGNSNGLNYQIYA